MLEVQGLATTGLYILCNEIIYIYIIILSCKIVDSDWLRDVLYI